MNSSGGSISILNSALSGVKGDGTSWRCEAEVVDDNGDLAAASLTRGGGDDKEVEADAPGVAIKGEDDVEIRRLK